jgi:alpha-glucosidase
MQRYAVGVNQGDYWATWKLMQLQTHWLLHHGTSGIFMPEADIGGHYAHEELDDELCIRWAFLGAFTPIMRSHGHNWRCKLPWGFGPQYEKLFTSFIRLRVSLFPYNYTLLHEANKEGIPMMRAMGLEFPHDSCARSLGNQFMWGPSILVAPVYEKGAKGRKVYLPEGNWVHYWSLKCYRATKPDVNSAPDESDGQFAKQGEELQVNFDIDAPRGRDPLFLKAGSIIPCREPTDTIPFNGESNLVLWVLPDNQAAEFELYDDDRRSYKYEKGEYSTQTFKLTALDTSGAFSLTIRKITGDHEGIVREKSYILVIPKSLTVINNVTVNGNSLPVEKIAVDEVSLKIDPRGIDRNHSLPPKFIHDGALSAEPLCRDAPACLEDENKYVIRLAPTGESLLVSFNE